jgi:hypothetical protein
MEEKMCLSLEGYLLSVLYNLIPLVSNASEDSQQANYRQHEKYVNVDLNMTAMQMKHYYLTCIPRDLMKFSVILVS